MRIGAAILGCSGPRLTRAEAAFFDEARPWGFILFGRNIEDPSQLRALCDDLRSTVGRPDAPILVDQEGGRVQRLGPPHWRAMPAPRRYQAHGGNDLGSACDLARAGGQVMAAELRAVGITVNSVPVLDTPQPDAHAVIGDRAYAEVPEAVAAIGRAAAEGLLAAGVLPIIKHIPGHGRAKVDSHEAAPQVAAGWSELERWDFAPFRQLADMPMAMSAHVVYACLDAERPATLSRRVLDRAVRGAIGFQGLLMSDDIGMAALKGGLDARSAAAREAGCDVVLHASGSLDEMAAVSRGAGLLDGQARERAQAALARAGSSIRTADRSAQARFEAAFPDARAA